MNYYTRLTAAALLALVVHLLFLAYVRIGEASRDLDRLNLPEPMVLNLQPPERDRPRRLIETTAPAEDIERDTDLISNASSEARDTAPDGEDAAQPSTEEASDFDELSGAPAQPAMPIPPQAPVEAEEESTEEQESESTEVELEQPKAEEALEPPDTPVEEPDLSSESFEETEPAEVETESETPPAEELPEPFDLAQNPTPPLTESLGSTRARESAGADESGPISFEANNHALGEYMLNVRRQVERTWRTSIQFKYSGTTQASALLECSIRPDGTLEHVKILERGESMVYAALCKQAIERAAPFGTFPFDVPEAYRSENLVIRWKFSFL